MKMRTATLLTLALAVIVIVVAILATTGQLPDDDSAPGGDAAPSTAESAEPFGPTAAPEEPAPTDSSVPNPDDGGQGGQEEGPSRKGPGPLGPPRASADPLISPPLPKTASRTGTLVTGFPSGVISLAPGSTVVFSSVAAEGDRLQVGLNAMSTIAPAEVLAHYSTALAGLGLVAASAPALDGSTAAAFIRGPNTVTVTVSSAGGGSRYTVFGVFVAGS